MLVVENEVFDDTIWDEFKGFASFFGDLDLGMVESALPTSATWDILDAYHQSVNTFTNF